MTKIFQKMPKLASGTTLKSQVSPSPPSPPHPHLGQMSRRPNVVLYFKTNNCAHDLKEFLTQTSSQGYSHSVCLTESKPL